MRWPSLLAALTMLAWPALAADIAIPPLTGRVVDQAGVLSNAEEAGLAGKAADLEARTSDQLVIVTLSSLNEHSIAEWGRALGRGWGIGQEDRDTGVLLIVAPSNRKVRIEVGYGLEGTLTDATASRIVRNVIIPRFKSGDLPGGISDGVDAIMSVLSGSGETFERPANPRRTLWLAGIAAVVAAGWSFLIYSTIRDRRRGTTFHASGRAKRRYGHSRTRVSFRGGGGSFGGGGASGRW